MGKIRTPELAVNVRRVASVLFLLLSLHGADPAAGKSAMPEEYRPEKIAGFALHLIEQKEYYRAWVELLRLRSYHPGCLSDDAFDITSLYLFMKAGRSRQVLGHPHDGKPGPAGTVRSLFRTDALFSLAEYGAARRELDSAGEPDDGDLELFRFKRIFLANIFLGNTAEAGELLDRRGKRPGFDPVPYRDIIGLADDRYGELGEPWKAAVAGIIPGMGYVYAGRRPTGIIALAVISVFSAVTFFAFRTDNRPIGIFTGTVTLFFYGGSIMGGYMETGRRNREILDSLNRDLCDELSLDGDRDIMFRRYGLAGRHGR